MPYYRSMHEKKTLFVTIERQKIRFSSLGSTFMIQQRYSSWLLWICINRQCIGIFWLYLCAIGCSTIWVLQSNDLFFYFIHLLSKIIHFYLNSIKLGQLQCVWFESKTKMPFRSKAKKYLRERGASGSKALLFFCVKILLLNEIQ